jgi:hypothetical protein
MWRYVRLDGDASGGWIFVVFVEGWNEFIYLRGLNSAQRSVDGNSCLLRRPWRCSSC